MRNNRYFSLLWALILLLGVGCSSDTVDERYRPDFGEAKPWEEGEEVTLGSGMVNASMRLDFERRTFKYFVPDDLPESGVALVFDFHGHLPYMPDYPYDPVGGFNEYDPFCVIAKKEKIIIVHPVGSIVDDLGVFGWNDQELNARFFDKMVAYFKAACPALDENKIYITGISSGGIFAYGLAALRSDVIAASVPLAGQYSLTNDFIVPKRAVPIRTYVGTNDQAVNCEAAYGNHFVWANTLAGCTKDNVRETSYTISVSWYSAQIKHTEWLGGSAAMEFCEVVGGNHGLNTQLIYPQAWEFMKANPKNK